ncbi:hypothetical protein OHB41_47340 [Streptomyces sp. NBC_01571]|uniref:hypothetical protein n=1 Tax=Streptomyces sp. NBC_01571 TaxID=2975883 RepID=UPI002251916D|nr:hypothetical protein [Streptomyces sp. NBC_01571]MCX4580623.1 hypothetical protein [Streptomyces sp. NBC_01571]
MTSVLLRDSLGDWTDFDVAGYRLGEFLGVIPPERSFDSVKGFFWIDGFPLGIMLDEMLESMVKAGFLEKNDDLQYRWNPAQPDIGQPLDEEPLPPLT